MRAAALCAALVITAALLAMSPASAADPWPADSGTQIWSGGEPSGIVWHERLEKLFWVHDNGYVRQMDTAGTLEHDWYIGGDLEGVTIVDPSSDYIYVGYEQGGAGVHISEFDVTTGALTGKTWVFSEMSGHGNAGMEGLTFVPNGAHPYSDSSSGGLFYGGLEYDGNIYVYDVDLSVSGSVTYIDTIPGAGTPVCGLHYHSETETLYVVLRNAGILRETTTDGTFIADYTLPSGCCYEGVTLIPSSPSTTTDLYIAYDNGPIVRYGGYPVTLATDFIKGPWVQNVTESGIVVMWEANEQETTTPTVDYGETASYSGGTVQATYSSVNGYPVYSADITGLSADTIYHYRVTSGSSESDDATFKTATQDSVSGFRFYVAGDNRTYPLTWGPITDMILEDMSEYPEHHQTFILNTGDIVTDGRDYTYWDELVPPAQSALASLPLYVGLGNHEDRNTAASDAFIYGYFDFPYAESGSTDEKWYSFDYGNVHVAAMALWDGGGYTSGAQYNWIQNDLEAARLDAQTDWSFVLMHFTPWSLGAHDEAEHPNIQTYLHPVFMDEEVVCAFGGHNHLYARYAPIDGVSYITAGGGGAELHTGSYSAWPGGTLDASAQVHHYCVVDVESDVAAVRAIDTDGNRLDYVTFGGTPADRPPFADAGANVPGTTGAQVDLDGTASEDPEASGITYEWTQVAGPSVALSGANTSQPYFTTYIGGDYVFQLLVNDGTYWSAPDFCKATVSSGGDLTFYAEADTFIDSLNADTNYGSNSALLIDTDSHEYHSYVRFNVTGVTGTVQSATLRLYCFDAGNSGVVRACSDTTWSESSPTWNSPLDEGGAAVGTLANPAAGAWSEVDVTDAVAGNGKVTFVILPSDADGADFHSRENTNDPQLVVTYAEDLSLQDSDGDGISDYDEILWDGLAGYDPYHPVTNPSGTDMDTSDPDTDDDGWSDMLEATCGGDPIDAGTACSTVQINFQPEDSTAAGGYCSDFGQDEDDRGYGWL